MQDTALVSIIVPIYGIERYVGICIESLLKQTYKNIEIILVDDGSPDRCPELCDLYAKKDSRIKVIHKENGGLVSARKAGLQIAQGKFVGYVDGDDWVEPDFYEKMVKIALEYNTDVVCAGQSRDLFDKSVSLVDAFPQGLYSADKLERFKMTMLSFGNFYRLGVSTYVWNKLFSKKILYQHQMNVDERITIGEDAAVVYPVFMNSKCVYIDDNVGYHYRQREDSMLKKNTDFSLELKKIRYLYDYMHDFAKKYGFNLIKQVTDYVLGICIIRSGGRLPDNSYSVYSNAYYGKKIVVYSAGTFGQQLINRFNEKEHCQIVAWVDDDYWEYRRCCLDVDSVESVGNLDYDYILIAAIDEHKIKHIVDRLIGMGISKEKVLTVDCTKADRRNLLHCYLEQGIE